MWCRQALLRYVSQHDVSKDGIRTPELLLVVRGDERTLESVRDALQVRTRNDELGMPCLVLGDSGGAASDIARAWQEYIHPHSATSAEDRWAEGSTTELRDAADVTDSTGPTALPSYLSAITRVRSQHALAHAVSLRCCPVTHRKPCLP